MSEHVPILLPKLKLLGEIQVTKDCGRQALGRLFSQCFDSGAFFEKTLRDFAPMSDGRLDETITVNYAPVKRSGIVPTQEELKEARHTILEPPYPEIIDAFLNFDSCSFQDVDIQYNATYHVYHEDDAEDFLDPTIPEIAVTVAHSRLVFGSYNENLHSDPSYVHRDTTIYVAAFGGDMLNPMYPKGISGGINDLSDPALADAFRESFVDTVSRIRTLHW